MLIEPGDRVLVEEPSYLAALQAFALAGAVVVPVACDGDGLDPDAVAAAAAEHGARLLYTIPTFHNPTGRTLPLERRRALAAIAERHGLWLIEDDPYGELRYRGEPLPSLATMAEDRTLALSTLSKVAAPGCGSAGCGRLRRCAGALVVAKQAADLHSSTVDQAAAARWLGTVDLDAHIGVLRAEYGRRRDALLDGLVDALPPGRPTTAPRAACSSGRGCPTAGTPSRCSRARSSATSPSCPAIRSSPASPTARTLRFSFTTHPRPRSPRVWRG